MPALLNALHGLAALAPSVPLGDEPALGDLPSLTGQGIGRAVKHVGERVAALVHVALHAASASSRSRAVTMYSRPPSRRTGSSPELASRYAADREMPRMRAARGTDTSSGRPSRLDCSFMSHLLRPLWSCLPLM